MCEAKPGVRCAHDTAGAAADALSAYQQAYPDGPAVDPVTAASSGFAPEVRERFSIMDSDDPEALRATTRGKWVAIDERAGELSRERMGAEEQLRDVTSLAEARAASDRLAAATYAQYEHRLDSVARARELDAVGRHAWALEEGYDAMVDRAMNVERDNPGWSAEGLHQKRRELIRELDRAVDDGKLASHPWRDQTRSEYVARLRERAASDEGYKYEAQQQLALLRAPHLLARMEIEATRAGEPSRAAMDYAAYKFSAELLDAQFPNGW